MRTALPDSPSSTPLGRGARALWALRDDAAFLNHGSFGARPRAVTAAQDWLRAEFERHPDGFMQEYQRPGAEAAPRLAVQGVARLLGVPGEQLALCENVTTCVQAVLHSVPLAAGDRIVFTDHCYSAVRLGIEARCRQTGAEPVAVSIPLPTTADEITQRLLDAAAAPRTRLVVLDHVTSPTALVMPVAAIATELRRRGVLVLLDGAQSLGQIPVDVLSMHVDWFATNAHKWLYAPVGTALLYASPQVAPLTRPLLVSHQIDAGFPRSFDYIGTRDYTAWLSVPAALSFFQEIGPERLWKHNAELVDVGSKALLDIGAEPVAPRNMAAAMRTFILPQTRAAIPGDAEALCRQLWECERIQVRTLVFSGRLLLRFCAQAYVDAEELRRLGAALGRHGWPGRSFHGWPRRAV